MRTRWSLPVVVMIATALFVAACGDSGSSSASSCEDDDVVVETGDNFFSPQELEIAAGTTVCWDNAGRIMHNVVPDEGDLFRSDRLDPGDVYRFTFEEPGTYPYYCSYHGAPGVGQWGTVIVT